jgi:hypothetical protein
LDDFAQIEEEIASFTTGSRTGSTGLLAWFLTTVWRLEPEEVDDAICDGGGDKGIDALVVDDELGEITVFQSKHRQSAKSGQGDADLKNLVGAAAYFESPAAVDGLIASKPNAELTQLLTRLNIRSKVEEGAHATRVVFVTNALLDPAGRDYMDAVASRRPALEVWDRDRLAPVASWTRRPELRPEPVALTTSSIPSVRELDAETTIAIALVDAEDLVALPGIEDLTIFGRNVRLELGRTRINRELGETLRDKAEHPLFPAYHNGLTILTRQVQVDGSELLLDGATVVNGCQSLLALHRNRAELSPDVKVLVKVVAVDPQSDLSDKITYRTNNQNPVDLRDQRSTDPIQRQLQAEMQQRYGSELAYGIRAGERYEVEVLDNRLAAQLITAVYLAEPWAAVRRVRLFDEDYRRIFNRAVTADRLFLLHRLNRIIEGLRSELRADLAASFASVRFTLVYLVAKVLQITEEGNQLLASPERWLPESCEEVDRVITDLARDVIQSVNFYIKAREDEAEEAGTPESFDPKVVFKSKPGVGQVEQDVLRDARRHALREESRDEEYLFRVPPSR